MQEIQNSQYRLRKAIGFLGIGLPMVIWVTHGKLLSSISHYYYTSSSVFFIGILFSFGLTLIAYKGYPKNDKKRERISDDWITTLAGICILITVLIPTKCIGSGDSMICCNMDYLFGHSKDFWGRLHLFSAATFIFLLGLMCIKKFTLSENEENKKRNQFYKLCGYIIWSCIGLLIVLFSLEALIEKFDFNNYVWGFTFILESIAVWAFGIAWLIKGKFDRDIRSILHKTDKAE